jgi:hypothetical protein
MGLTWLVPIEPFRLSGITIDCVEPELVARFWGALLGEQPEPSLPGWFELGDRHSPRPRINFQPVPERKNAKVRIHLDLSVEDIDRAMAAVLAAGGRPTGERHDYAEGVVVVMADPEGNEFGLVQFFADPHRFGAVVLSC